MLKKILFVIGIIIALIGAAIMIEGSILGERTIPAAVVISLVGICVIATSSRWKAKKP